MDGFARAARNPTRVYLVGGTTAVLLGWRQTTIDIDFVIRPEDDSILRELPAMKERLEINLELASPLDFIPVPEGWEDRSPLIKTIGNVSFHHFDPYAQVLAKIERGHAKDMTDAREFLDRGLIDPRRLRAYFAEIESGCIDFRRLIRRRSSARWTRFFWADRPRRAHPDLTDGSRSSGPERVASRPRPRRNKRGDEAVVLLSVLKVVRVRGESDGIGQRQFSSRDRRQSTAQLGG